MSLDEERIGKIVDRVVARLSGQPDAGFASGGPVRAPGPGASTSVDRGGDARPGLGVHDDLDVAVDTAHRAYRHLQTLPLDTRRRMVSAMRHAVRASARLLAEMAVAETGMGRVEDKIKKNLLVGERTPGVEILTSETYTGDHGMTLIEYAPYGVVAAVTPSTNPSETVINNTIGMVAAGNAVVVAPHPSAARVTLRTVEILNEAIAAAGGPRELITGLGRPSIEATQALMVHPKARLVVVTGGPGVVKAAMGSGKKVVAAGPGNPPVVVDATADVRRAAHDIVRGASLDNNIVCSDEKEVIAVNAVADHLLTELGRADAVVLDDAGVREVTNLLFTEVRGPRRHAVMDRRWIGQDAAEILRAISRPADDRVRLVVAPVDADHPLLWTEQLCPVMPVTRVADVGDAVELAREVEHGYGHTAVMHSRDVTELSRMARLMDTCIFVKNGPAYAGLGYGGEGPTSFTIAHPTGDGLTNARTFSRIRRCVLVDAFRIV